MTRQSDYLPDGLPHNRGSWPAECREMEWLDLRANQLIHALIDGKTDRHQVEAEIGRVAERHRDHFKRRLNHWREHLKK
ncbi:hypothetical protein NM75_09125 [Dickeya fangzhongdai]|nr:hypothetical protein [Dickeya fangzhongdai]AIR71450.1 hypothetical protein LH89_20390 [Dickeya fangzhongdai]KGT98481.1 hypothetical protein NM75_09125 [Dickeya fangzhongdai]